MLTTFLVAFAYLNEHGTKRILKLPRPCHSYVFRQSKSTTNIFSFYTMKESDRKLFVEKLINTNQNVFSKIDKKVLSHWVEESGYSFPSGHSFNAFLLASVLAFSLHKSHNVIANKFYFLPFIWATLVGISRVAIGAHSPIDVTTGAGMGMIIAILFLYFPATRKWVSPEMQMP